MEIRYLQQKFWVKSNLRHQLVAHIQKFCQGSICRTEISKQKLDTNMSHMPVTKDGGVEVRPKRLST